jgi:hypothetical protein
MLFHWRLIGHQLRQPTRHTGCQGLIIAGQAPLATLRLSHAEVGELRR